MRFQKIVLTTLAFAGTAIGAPGMQAARPDETKPVAQAQEPVNAEADPFADLTESQKPQQAPVADSLSWRQKLFTENFGFRKEIMSQFDVSEKGQPASRQSVGFEALKKFSTATTTVASFNFQGRFVRRDGFHPVVSDLDGESRPGWAYRHERRIDCSFDGSVP